MPDAAVIKAILEQVGLSGLIILGAGYGAWKLHQMRTAELKASIEEHRADKTDYRNVITGNTEALTKMAGALESNTQALRDLKRDRV